MFLLHWAMAARGSMAARVSMALLESKEGTAQRP